MTEIPREVLSEKFQTTIDGRPLRSAVFLTFRFDPGFFEQEVLPAFLDVALSHVPEIRLLNLADTLRAVESIAVYYDRVGLEAGAASSKLDIQRMALSHPTGYFHPKNVLALVGNEGSESLIVGTMSSNLTRAGWWENVEVAHVEELKQDVPCSYRDDLLSLLRRIRKSAEHIERHDALDAIERFVKKLSQVEQHRRDGIALPRLFAGEEVVPWLRGLPGNRLQRKNLEILSPYFDNKESIEPITQLREAFKPKEIRVFLPRGPEGEALCSAPYYERVREIAEWGDLPKDVMQLSKDVKRNLHAKVYRFFDPADRYEAFFIGSVNLTGAAFNRGGNVETGFFVEMPEQRRLDWWMSIDRKTPAAFATRKEDEGLEQGLGYKLSLRYDWNTRVATVFWDAASPSPKLTLLSHGVDLCQVDALPPRQWRELPADDSHKIEDALGSSAFVTVRISGERDAQILVAEESMTHKPSLMKSFTADQILQYWALLTAEQKKEFLEEHADAFSDPELAMWLPTDRNVPADESFFHTFAQLYLSFGNLERAVHAALGAKREREAVDRLFGKKFDSLRRLLEEVNGEDNSDAVRRYVTLLCARQLLNSLEANQSEFIARHRPDVLTLEELLHSGEKIRKAFTFGEPLERETFFRWFEKWFVKRAEPVKAAAE